MKKLKVLDFLVIGVLATPAVAFTNIQNNSEFIIFFPSLNQIIIDDIYSGKAKTADGIWTGISAIPPKYKDNWKKNINKVNYAMYNGGYCQYFINATEAIDLRHNSFPEDYKLYSIQIGVVILSNCWDKASQTPIKEPSYEHPCYYYKNPVM